MPVPKSQFQNIEWVLNQSSAGYLATHQDLENATYQYYGFMARSGAWRILRFHIISNRIIYEYAEGTTPVIYEANWDVNGNYIGTLTFRTPDLL